MKINHLRKISKIEDEQKWRPFNGSCLTQCPEGYEDHVDENKVWDFRRDNVHNILFLIQIPLVIIIRFLLDDNLSSLQGSMS